MYAGCIKKSNMQPSNGTSGNSHQNLRFLDLELCFKLSQTGFLAPWWEPWSSVELVLWICVFSGGAFPNWPRYVLTYFTHKFYILLYHVQLGLGYFQDPPGKPSRLASGFRELCYSRYPYIPYMLLAFALMYSNPSNLHRLGAIEVEN